MTQPKHIAIIMDGNGRWAESRGRPRTFGHIKGARVAKKIISECARLKIQHLTLYAFSSENWLRPQIEVNFLMSLLKRYLKKEVQSLVDQNIKFKVIGELSRLSPDVLQVITTTIKATEHCTGMELIFAISYGGQQEILEACRVIAEKAKNQEIQINDIDEELFESCLNTFPSPDPDLIIRTSGECRLSNFLLWQSAYSELYFTSIMWPDFNEKHLNHALQNFQQRERRFGGVIQHESPSH